MNKYHKICKIGKGSSGDVILVKGKVASNQNKVNIFKLQKIFSLVICNKKSRPL